MAHCCGPLDTAHTWLRPRAAASPASPLLCAAQGADNPHVKVLRERAASENCEVVVVSAKVESELTDMPEEEAKVRLGFRGGWA